MEPGYRFLSRKGVLKVKRDVNEKIARLKARWVMKDPLQWFGIKFDQTFAALVKPMTFRVLFAIAPTTTSTLTRWMLERLFLWPNQSVGLRTNPQRLRRCNQ